MSNKHLDRSILLSTVDSLEFVTNVLQPSIEYSVIARGMDGTILIGRQEES